jgi:hypothetical protein
MTDMDRTAWFRDAKFGMFIHSLGPLFDDWAP